MDVSVVVATFGDEKWGALAQERAIPSAEAQSPRPLNVWHCHGETLAEARNEGLSLVETEWVIFLDADDELEPGYVEAMAKGTADVRGPVARYVRRPGHQPAVWIPHVWGHNHRCEADCLRAGNWVIIGAAARTDLIRAAGGWVDFEWSEDWAVWAKLHKAGASFELIENAVYRAHVRLDSRNRGASDEKKLAVHREIERHVWPEDFETVAA